MDVPRGVAAAARAHRPASCTSPLPRSPLNRTVRRGDLRLIVPPHEATGEARLGLVLNVDPTLPDVEIALVHTCLELATSMDGVVSSARAGTPFDVVVQSDLRGVVWKQAQVSELVGRLLEETLNEISDLIELGRPGSTDGVRIGTPIAGPNDRRWPFKVAEGKALDRLTSDCASKVIDW